VDLAAIRRLINSGEPQKALDALRVLPPDQDPSRQATIELLRGVSHYQKGDPGNNNPEAGRINSTAYGNADPQRNFQFAVKVRF
jgi:hypothetical protein